MGVVVGVSMLPQATRASQRSHQQSQATEGSNATSADNCTESHSSHDNRESHGPSKYVQAMRNPDWRRKDSHSQEVEHPRSESLGFERAGYKSSSRPHTGTEGSHEANDTDSSGSWDLVDCGRLNQGAQLQQNGKAKIGIWDEALTHSEDLKNRKNPGLSPGLCQFVSHKSMPHAWPMSLMEVRPVSQQQIAAQTHDLKLLRIRRKDEGGKENFYNVPKMLSDEQSEQFSAALQAVDKTPRKSQRSSQIPIRAHDSIKTGRELMGSQPHSRYLIEPKTTAVTGHSANEHIQQSLEAKKESQVGGMSAASTDTRFNKLLEKLHRRSRETQSSERKSFISDISSQEAIMGAHRPAYPRPHVTNAEKRRAGLTNSSDSGCEHVEAITRLMGGQDAAHAGFNPRAREFLSFSGKTDALEEEDRHSKFRRSVPIDQLFQKDRESSDSKDELRGPGSDSDSLPWYDPKSTMFSPRGVAPYLALPPQGITCQPVFGMNWLSNQGTVPPTTVAPLVPNFPLCSNVPGGLWAGSLPTGDMGPPATGPSTMLPMQNWSASPGFSAMPGQQAAGITQSTRPPPVPKPRRPDPSNQQAYEAWIEWRKANEPGYALECKLRQQRRSQRNVTTATKPKIEQPPKPETTADAVASA